MTELTADRVRRALALATPSQRLRLDAFARGYKPLWVPNEGPQTDAYDHMADVTGYGGAAGGGKSQLVTGLAMTQHRRTLIIRQEKVSTRKFVQDIAKAKGDRDGYSSQGSTWAFTGPDGVDRLIEFAGMENEGDEEKQQGVDYDCKCVGAGTLVWMADGTRKPIEQVQVGDLVDTLEGARAVTRTMQLTKPAVRVEAADGWQIQGSTHKLLTTAGWASYEIDGCHQCLFEPFSPIPIHDACKCAGSLSLTCEARSPIPGIPYSDRSLPQECALGHEDRRCTSARCVDRAHTDRESDDARRCDPRVECARHLLPNLRSIAPPLTEQRQSEFEATALIRRNGGLDVDLPSSLQGLTDHCLSDRCRDDARLRCAPAVDRSSLRRSGDVERRSPTCLLVDARPRTPTRSHRMWSYDHPYTKETRRSDRSVREQSLVYSDAGVCALYDLTVEGANHYITGCGFVNRNCYDEVTQMRESQVRYTIGWARTDIPGQRVRVLLTFNPPTTAEGRWIIKFFAPWLDRKHPRPAKDGELRWFTTIGDNEDYEVDGPEPFVIRADGSHDYGFDPAEFVGAKAIEIIKPMSRTFITARVTDNPYYMHSGYIRQLQALPEPLRSQMLRGDFSAGVEDPAWQVIPTAWIEAAMARWRPRDAKGPMDSMGVDAARGGNSGSTLGSTGNDKMVIARRHGVWYDRTLAIKGVDVNDGFLAASQVIRFRTDHAPVHIDVIGIGTSPYDVLQKNNIQTIAINGSAKSLGVDTSGLLQFTNLRSELHWRMREALDPKNPDPIALPPEPELLADLAAPTYALTPRGIQVESKDDIKKRIKRSPDKGDAVIYALVTTPKVKYERTGFLDPAAAALEGDYEATRFNALRE